MSSLATVTIPGTRARPGWTLRLVAAWVLAWLLPACPSEPPAWPEDQGFEDHTFARVESLAHFGSVAARGPTQTEVLKFVIVDFDAPQTQQLRFLDGTFDEFHDEWYWFRLLNGQRVPGSRERPPGVEREFASPAEIVNWVRARKAPPPLGMRMIDERLYSDHFYELSVRRRDRSFGIGALVHMPAREQRDELWGFELEYSDELDEAELERFFAALEDALPSEIATQLKFIARSPKQERLVERLIAARHPAADRLTSYAQLAVPGEVEVYNPGLIAGRLRKLPRDPARAAAVLAEQGPGVIWMMASVPDELPAAAGLLTAVPQTPLAHVNLLARNRGIPNAYVGGLYEDPHLDQLARVHTPVIVLAEAGGELRIEPIDEESYARWRSLSRTRQPTLTRVDPARLPTTLDLESEPVERMPELRAVIGGKSAGFLALRAAGVTMPERALAITIRPYAEHVAALRPIITDALADPAFRHDARVRYVLLEGREDFAARFSSPADREWLAEFQRAHPAKRAKRDPLAALLVRDGIKRAIRERPLDAAAAAEIDRALRAHFGHQAASQGLRFRSSSTVEDVEGFSGAGLYDSNTGFFDPAVAGAKPTKTVEWALRKTWASYWSWEAFEERRMSGIEHLDGHMAVLVHPRFDDDLERANGVITFTLDLGGSDAVATQGPLRTRATMEIDVQLGALSVTNPPPERAGEVLPEILRVIQRRRADELEIERVAASTELPEGRSVVLDEDQVRALFAASLAVAERWLAVENLAFDEGDGRARESVTLDLEFRDMAAGWPALADGGTLPARMVIKQARSLDPGVPAGAESLLGLPIPRDLLIHAARVEAKRCQGTRTRIAVLEVFTDVMAVPAFGYDRSPFVAQLRLDARRLTGGPRDLIFDHENFALVEHPGVEQGAPWSLHLDLEPSEVARSNTGVDRIELEGGLLRLIQSGAVLSEEPAPCASEVLFSSPEGFLRSLL